MNDNNMNKGNDIKNKLAKKAVTSVAGPLAGKAVDKLGPTAFKNSDLINKGSKAPTGASELPKEGLEDGNNGLQEPASKESSRSPLSNLGKRLGLGGASDVTGEVDASARIFSFIRKHWKVSAAVIGGGTLILLLLLAIPIIVASIGGGVIEFFSGIGDAIIGFFSPDEQELIEEYYEELKEVKNDFYTRYGICIDTNLITATLTVDVDAQEYSNEINNEPGEDKATGGEEGESDEVETEKDYKKMKKEVGILASMQIKRTLYGHNKNVKNGTEDCRSEEEGPEEELVSEENLENLEFPDFWDKFIKSVSSEEAKIEK